MAAPAASLAPVPTMPPGGVAPAAPRCQAAPNRSPGRPRPPAAARPRLHQLGMVGPAPPGPDKITPARYVGIEARGDGSVGELPRHRLEHHALRPGHQHAAERRQRIRQHGLGSPPALGRLGTRIAVGVSFLANWRARRASGSARRAASSTAGQQPRSSSRAERHPPGLDTRVSAGPRHLPQHRNDGAPIRRADHQVGSDFEVKALERFEGGGFASPRVG